MRTLNRFLVVALAGISLGACDVGNIDLSDVDWRVSAPFPSYYTGTFITSQKEARMCLVRDEDGSLEGYLRRGEQQLTIIRGTYEDYVLDVILSDTVGEEFRLRGQLFARNLAAPLGLTGYLYGPVPQSDLSVDALSASFRSRECP